VTETSKTTTAVVTGTTTTDTGISKGGAAAVGAAAATAQTDEDSTPWGWIAAGIIALALLLAGVISWRRRHRTNIDTA
jgi:LPXTG-motif cell wall-anchored protein